MRISQLRNVFLALALLCGGGVASAAQIPVSDFFKHAKYQDIKISPDGRYLAATVPVADETRLAVIDREAMALKQVFTFGANRHVTEFHWVGDDRLIMRSAIKVGWFARPASTGDLWAANVDGNRKKQLIARSGFTINSLLRHDPEQILVTVFNRSNYPDVMRIDVYRDWEENERGQMTRARDNRELRVPVRNGRILADHSGVIRAAVGSTPEGEAIVMYRESEDAEWREVGRYDPQQGALIPLQFHPDNRRMYMGSTLNAATEGLVLFDPDSGEQELLFRHDWVDIGQLVVARDRQTVIGVRYHPDRPALHLLEPDHADAQVLVGLMNAFPGQEVSITGYTDEGTEGVVLVYSDRNPGEFFIFDASAGALKPLVQRMPWIAPGSMPEREPVVITARDGLALHGYLTRPQDRDSNLPLIVLPHGGPHGPRDFWYFDPEAAFFADRGYAVLQVNFRGSGGYGRDFEYAGYRKWGREMQDDLTDATQWAVEQGIADPQRMCIYGASYGGYAAVMGVVKEPELYDCAVGYVGVYDLPLMFRKGDIPETVDGKEYLKRALGEDEQDLVARSPARQVDRIKAGLFLVHGEEDVRAHFAHYGVLTEALDAAGIPYQSMVKAKEGHGFFDETNREQLYTRMWEFFDRHIGAGAQTSASNP